MAGSLIRSAILGGAAELTRAHRARPGQIARRPGLPITALTDPDLLVRGTAVLHFFEVAAEVCRLRTWGLSMARGARLATIIGPLWILLRNAQTVGQMCDELADNFDLYSDAAMVSVEPVKRGALLSWTTTTAQHDSEMQMAEFALSVIASELRSHLHRGWMPAAVLFRHAKPAGLLALHQAAFGSDLRFNQDRNALLLDGATLDAPVKSRGSAARALASRVVRLEEGRREKHFARDVEAVVRSLIPYAPCTIGEVSRALDLASRTLQLRPKEERTSFTRIHDAVRADLASKYLRYSDLSAAQIAEILGYATPRRSAVLFVDGMDKAFASNDAALRTIDLQMLRNCCPDARGHSIAFERRCGQELTLTGRAQWDGVADDARNRGDCSSSVAHNPVDPGRRPRSSGR